MSLSPVVIDLKFDALSVARSLERAFPGRGKINMADPANRGRVVPGAAYCVLWNPDHDLFQRMPDLKVIFSGGAGVDRILQVPTLPDVPIVRFVDPTLTNRMSEWAVLQCLSQLRQTLAYAEMQARRQWRELIQPEASELTVGIMGLGVLGLDAARKLKMMGFNTIGWSRTKKQVDGMETFDAAGLDSFLGKTDILLGLLPLTPETTGIYNAALFSKLRQGGALGQPVFINGGRGGSQVEADLIRALTDGTLRSASLDVFETEPLPATSPLWGLKNVIITPHAAAASDERALFRHVEAQIARHESGLPLENVVDRGRGY
nr:glyoxylate/hydroxypyruvate reductase A [uncultured Gellertiella sp.]